tara:strand:- start:180 stop:929 length:750 start_codon:yes stop_codon:yes gene_type:complete
MQDNKNDLVLLLTGNITPNSISNITIKDPELRRQQYIEAIDFYLRNTDFKIVFVENSNDHLDSFPLNPGKIEYLTFNSIPIKPDRGIGYKEIEIIDYAFKNSKFLRTGKAVVKITGRLKVLNLNALSKKFLKFKANNPNLIYANPFDQKNMDARCFFFTRDFWPYLMEAGKNISLKYNFEFALWDSVCEYKTNQKNKFKSLNIPLRIEGLSGSYGIKYKHHLLIHYARFIRIYYNRILGKRLVKRNLMQ